MSDQDDRSRKAQRDLDRLSEEGGLLNAPKLKGKSKSVKGHFMADDVDQSDRIEVWGSRIGRILSLIAVGLLLIWLVNFLQNS
ncbi:hypothetical protein [Hoeflea sp. TYP-13]|uniref:hypothetical protein n=1 Tax=Hoeflea sp. TYP-13 TaxID=3230023 RepID=UPI0034C601B7